MKSISDLAEELGVTPAIIRSWQINLNLDHPRYSPEEPVYDGDWEHFFQEVARLRKQGKSFSKIRNALSREMPSAEILPEPGAAVRKNGNGRKQAASFQPPEIQATESQSMIRSDLDEEDELGVYGPPAPDALSFSFSSRDRRPKPNLEEPGSALMRMQQQEKGLAPVQHLQRDMYEAMLEKDMGKMARTYGQMLESYQTLASRFSETTYVIGQLEEKNRSLEHQIQDKEKFFQEKEESQIQRIQELEAHLQALKSSLNHREADLSHQKEKLVQREQMEEVEKQIKMLAVTVFKQQEAMQASENQGFWQRFKQRWLGR